jgi:polyisoprenoid-binding protein YceI
VIAESDRRRDRSCRPLAALVFVLLLMPAALRAEPRAYRIEPNADSRFALEVFKTGLMSGKKHVLVFARFEGQLDYDAQRPEQSRVELTVDAASLVVTDDWVNEKDRAKIADEALNHQLAAKQYPQLEFRSASIRTAGGPGRYEVQGELTIRGTAKPVVVLVNMQEKDGGRLVFEGEGTVKMKDYGLKPPSAAMGMIGTKNEMLVKFRLAVGPALR